MATILKTLTKWLDSTDHTKELYDLAFIGTVVLVWFWLGHGVYKGKGFTEGWNQALLTLFGAVGLIKGNGAWANRDRGNQPPESLNPNSGGNA